MKIFCDSCVYNFLFLLKEILYKKQCKFCVLRTRLISDSLYFVFCNRPSEGIQKFIFGSKHLASHVLLHAEVVETLHTENLLRRFNKCCEFSL